MEAMRIIKSFGKHSLKLMLTSQGFELYEEYPTCQCHLRTFEKDMGDEYFIRFYEGKEIYP